MLRTIRRSGQPDRWSSSMVPLRGCTVFMRLVGGHEGSEARLGACSERSQADLPPSPASAAVAQRRYPRHLLTDAERSTIWILLCEILEIMTVLTMLQTSGDRFRETVKDISWRSRGSGCNRSATTPHCRRAARQDMQPCKTLMPEFRDSSSSAADKVAVAKLRLLYLTWDASCPVFVLSIAQHSSHGFTGGSI